MNTPNQIRHDENGQSFFLDIEGRVARLDYRLSRGSANDIPGSVNFTHTYVPQEFRGRGHAEKLVRHGLKWAQEQGLEIHASCWYVAKFLRP